jgi:hypothetical protein
MVMTQSWSNTIRVIIFSILLGGASGVLATALTTNYLSDYAIEISELTEPLHMIEARPTAFPESYQEAIEQFQADGLPAMALLSESSEDFLALSSDELVPAVVLTSDGWFATMSDAEFQMGATSQGDCEITQQEYDEQTGVSFVKCDARSLSVAGFGYGYGAEPGHQMFIADSFESFVPADVTEIYWSDEVALSSDVPQRRVLLSAGMQTTVGSAVFDLSGKFMGIVEEVEENGQITMLPIESMINAFDSLLKNDEIVYAELGVTVVDLSHNIVSDEYSRGYAAGALLYGASSVEYASAASEAGLVRGDIIVSVDRQNIDSNHSLDEFITARSPGDVLLLQVDRAGVLTDVSVTLH